MQYDTKEEESVFTVRFLFEKIQKRKQTKQKQTADPVVAMNRECLCDNSSEFTEEKYEEDEQEYLRCNRIFLNFSREFRHPAKDSFNVAKVKDLFKYLSERQDLQEMKVSGWLEDEELKKEENEEEEVEEEEEKDGSESNYEDGCTPRGGGQRFAMSRDFWYRKLNTLKAQKLDEVALEAKDLPPDDQQKDPKFMKWVKSEKGFLVTYQEKPDEIYKEINLFDKSVAKPVEKELKKRFVNVYNNRRYFSKDSC